MSLRHVTQVHSPLHGVPYSAGVAWRTTVAPTGPKSRLLKRATTMFPNIELTDTHVAILAPLTSKVRVLTHHSDCPHLPCRCR